MPCTTPPAVNESAFVDTCNKRQKLDTAANSTSMKRNAIQLQDFADFAEVPTTEDCLSRNTTYEAGLDDLPSTPATKVPQFSTLDEGEASTLQFRRYLVNSNGKKISPWHDVPLKGTRGGFHAIVEITKDTTAKMEVATNEFASPIKQDTKKGKLRDYNMPINWNYGMFPQTWEQPEHEWRGLEGIEGDNDPLDFVDLGSPPVTCGGVIEVKPVAALAMIDEGEVDWKVIVINMDDPRAALVDSKADAEEYFPGQIAAVREWFTWYKAKDASGERIPGSEPNVFAFDGVALNELATDQVITEAHGTWKELVQRRCDSKELVLA